jgi:tRNA G46 methylase TrmB
MISRDDIPSARLHASDSSMMGSWQNKHLTDAQRQTLRCEYEHLRSFIVTLPQEALLVDVGCGDARVLINVDLGGRRYIGIDIDAESVRAAREMCQELDGAHILEPQDYRDAMRELEPGGPIATLCLGGTFGSFPGDEREHLKASSLCGTNLQRCSIRG